MPKARKWPQASGFEFFGFKEILLRKNLSVGDRFEKVSASDIADVLAGFYADVRRKDGAEYNGIDSCPNGEVFNNFLLFSEVFTSLMTVSLSYRKSCWSQVL